MIVKPILTPKMTTVDGTNSIAGSASLADQDNTSTTDIANQETSNTAVTSTESGGGVFTELVC